MRIAYICQSYPPMVSGAALVVWRLAEGMAARHHDVLVLAASDRDRPYNHDAEDGWLRVARLRAWPNPFRVGQRFLLWPQLAIEAELREHRPHLIHLHDYSSSGLVGLRLGRVLGVPVVLTLHQLPWFISAYLPNLPGLRALAERLAWGHLRRFVPQCAATISPSQMIADIVHSQIGLRPTPLTNGVELLRFSPLSVDNEERARLFRKYELDPAVPVILHVGRIDADKQVDLVLRAVTKVAQTTPAQLLVAGDGTQRAAMERLSRALGIQAACRFPGFVGAGGDLPGLYRLADVFVTASEVEIQSSVVLEAAASGVPVVTVRASSMAEFVEDGVTGYLAEPRDVAGLADRLLTVLQQPPDHRQAMRQAALALARRHSIQSALTAHEQFYKRLVHG